MKRDWKAEHGKAQKHGHKGHHAANDESDQDVEVVEYLTVTGDDNWDQYHHHHEAPHGHHDHHSHHDHHTYHDSHEPYYIRGAEHGHPREVVYDEPEEVYDIRWDHGADFDQAEKRAAYEHYEEKGKPWTWRSEGQQYP